MGVGGGWLRSARSDRSNHHARLTQGGSRSGFTIPRLGVAQLGGARARMWPPGRNAQVAVATSTAACHTTGTSDIAQVLPRKYLRGGVWVRSSGALPGSAGQNQRPAVVPSNALVAVVVCRWLDRGVDTQVGRQSVSPCYSRTRVTVVVVAKVEWSLTYASRCGQRRRVTGVAIRYTPWWGIANRRGTSAQVRSTRTPRDERGASW